MRRRLFLAILVLTLLAFPSVARAQAYSFNVSNLVVHVFWNEDGTVSVDYVMTFRNDPSGHVIDYVDVPMPNNSFDADSVFADIEGQSLSDISRSGYQGTGAGVAVGLGQYTIPAGGTGTLHVFIGTINRMLYTDSSDPNYASAVFAPMRFLTAHGQTNYSVTFHLPPGVKPEEARWHEAPSGFNATPDAFLDENGRVSYTWTNPNGDMTREYDFGASFPKSYMAEGVVGSESEPAGEPIGTPTGAGSLDLSWLFPCGCVAFFGAFIALSLWGDKNRKLKYLPPKISIEGHGIKRGLTAVEAAILMEQPMEKVLTMILFSTIKKNAVTVLSQDPLRLQLVEPTPEGLQPYEEDFLVAINAKGTLERKEMQDAMIALVRLVTEKMKGFSRRETIAYYQDIMKQAWAQVEAASTPEIKSQKFDENMDWTMLDRDFNDRTRDVFRTGPVYVPVWWHRYDPTYSGPRPSGGTSIPTSTGGSARPSVGGGGLPTLPGADFAASVVGGVQTFSTKAVGNITEFTNKITGTTNPPPKPTSTTGGYRGGRSGGCACACACAGCACACAGGGR